MKSDRRLPINELLTLMLMIAAVLAFLFVDRQTHPLIVQISNNHILLILREVVTPFGKGENLGLLALILLVAGYGFKNPRLRTAGFLLIGSYLTSGAIALILKATVTRPRPYIPPEKLGQLGDSYYQSFPSGDAAAAMAAALAVGCVFPRARWWLIMLAIIIALFRVLRLAHWPSDALSGLFIGVAGYWVLMRLYTLKQRRA